MVHLMLTSSEIEVLKCVCGCTSDNKKRHEKNNTLSDPDCLTINKMESKQQPENALTGKAKGKMCPWE